MNQDKLVIIYCSLLRCITSYHILVTQQIVLMNLKHCRLHVWCLLYAAHKVWIWSCEEKGSDYVLHWLFHFFFFFFNHKCIHTVSSSHCVCCDSLTVDYIFIFTFLQNEPLYWLFHFLIGFYFFMCFSIEQALSLEMHESERWEEIQNKIWTSSNQSEPDILYTL